MEERKRIEIEHYDRLARTWGSNRLSDHQRFSSFQFCERWLKRNIKKGDAVLDYGCGNGIYSIQMARLGAMVMGIDLSGESLKVARRLAKGEGMAKHTRFMLMDCEAMKFPNNSFEIIFDGGTFSSLDLGKALPEIARVLKPTGTLIAIETLGHNPLANLKRQINKVLGRRTAWAIRHIVTIDDIKRMGKYFNHIETHYFHLLSLFAFPFLSLPGGERILSLLNRVDSLLLRIPFLQRYAFKAVIIAKNPNP